MQLEFVCDVFGILQILMGEMFCVVVVVGFELGKKVEFIMNFGVLVSDDLIVEVVKECLVQDDVQQGFFFDGYLWMGLQVEIFLGIFEESGIEFDYVVLIDVFEEELIVCVVVCGCKDDQEDVVCEC